MNRIECHLFSGLFGAGSENGTKELERLIDDLPYSVNAHHYHHNRWKHVRDGIIRRHDDLGKAIVILIGHSYGARRCQQLATALDKKNIQISYLAGIDPTAIFAWQKPMKLSTNIDLIDEFHATSGFPHNARKHDESGKSGGKFIVPSTLDNVHKIITVPGAHIPCPSKKITKARIIEKVEGIIQ